APAEAATAAERAFARAALVAMGRMAAGTLRMALSISARSCVATLALVGTLIVPAASVVLGASRLDRDARAGRTPMAMSAVTTPASTFAAFTACGRRQFERLECLDRSNKAVWQGGDRELLASGSHNIAQ